MSEVGNSLTLTLECSLGQHQGLLNFLQGLLELLASLDELLPLVGLNFAFHCTAVFVSFCSDALCLLLQAQEGVVEICHQLRVGIAHPVFRVFYKHADILFKKFPIQRSLESKRVRL